MINDVRNIVLSILNKENRGYVTPMEFNLYAKQAQLDIFENYTFLYSNAINKQNARMHGEGYSDIPKNIGEVIDLFSERSVLSYNTVTGYYIAPDDYYFLEKLLYNNNKEVEKVSHRKINYLVNSNLTAPTTAYPVYTLENDGILVYPNSIIPTFPTPPVPVILTSTQVTAQYIRYPKDPNWTYININNGEPAFDASAAGYQDFELPNSDFANLVVKILFYSGVQIREEQVTAAAKGEEVQDAQQKQ
jgi:hypothetical protein